MLLQVDRDKYQDFIVFTTYRANCISRRGPKEEYEWCGELLWWNCHSTSAWAHSKTKQNVCGHIEKKLFV